MGEAVILVMFVCLFYLILELTSQYTDMVKSGWSVHKSTLFPRQAWLSGLPVPYAHTFACN